MSQASYSRRVRAVVTEALIDVLPVAQLCSMINDYCDSTGGGQLHASTTHSTTITHNNHVVHVYNNIDVYTLADFKRTIKLFIRPVYMRVLLSPMDIHRLLNQTSFRVHICINATTVISFLRTYYVHDVLTLGLGMYEMLTNALCLYRYYVRWCSPGRHARHIHHVRLCHLFDCVHRRYDGALVDVRWIHHDTPPSHVALTLAYNPLVY
jgi:hypothetical protein